MPYFTTRVELHDAKDGDYDTLHAAMVDAGFSRKIGRKGEPDYKLPTAEYNEVGEFTIKQVLEKAKGAAAKTKKKFAVLVTQSEIARDWYGLDLA